MLQPPYRTSVRDTVSSLIHNNSRTSHFFNPLEVTVYMCPQNLGCDLLAMMLTLPYIRKPPVVHWGLCCVVIKRNF